MIIFQTVFKLWSGHGLHLKPSRGNNSESMKPRVVILVRDTSSWPVLHNCEVSWLYSIWYSSYRRTRMCIKKHQRGDNSKSMKARALIFVRDRSSWPFQHNWSIIKILQTVFKLLSGHENVYERTDGQTTDGRQAHRYIPRTFRSGDKKDIKQTARFTNDTPVYLHTRVMGYTVFNQASQNSFKTVLTRMVGYDNFLYPESEKYFSSVCILKAINSQ